MPNQAFPEVAELALTDHLDQTPGGRVVPQRRLEQAVLAAEVVQHERLVDARRAALKTSG